MGCSRVFTLSSKDCLFAGILERCLLLAPIPRPVSILDSRWPSGASPFFSASSSCSRKIRFSVRLMPRFARLKQTKRQRSLSVSLSHTLRFCSGSPRSFSHPVFIPLPSSPSALLSSGASIHVRGFALPIALHLSVLWLVRASSRSSQS